MQENEKLRTVVKKTEQKMDVEREAMKFIVIDCSILDFDEKETTSKHELPTTHDL